MSNIAELANCPELSFIESMTLQETEEQLRELYTKYYREATGKEPEIGEADPLNLLMKAFCAMEYQTMQYADAKGRMEMLKTSTGDALDALAALAETKFLQVRFIEMMPIGYGAAMPCISGPDLLARFRKRWPELALLSRQETAGIGDGPAVYYTAPGWQGSVGFIAAVHGKFCASCNRVRLTSQGFLRPCLASEAGCDLKTLLRSGASDEELLSAIRTTIWEKPQEHHFELKQDVPATRGMYRIGG